MNNEENSTKITITQEMVDQNPVLLENFTLGQEVTDDEVNAFLQKKQEVDNPTDRGAVDEGQTPGSASADEGSEQEAEA